MKRWKLPIICFTYTAIFSQGCDERITPDESINGGTGTSIGETGTSTTGGATGNTAQKITAIALKWSYKEVYLIINGKKLVFYSPNKIASLSKFSISITPDDY